MAYDQQLLDRVRAALGTTPNVTEKKMFGGIGVMVNGKLAFGIGEHDSHLMMIRVGKEAYLQALARKGAAPTIMGEREIKGYVDLNEEALQNDEDLDYWVKLALDFNKKLISAEK